MSSFDCFSGGTQPGVGVAIKRVVGSFDHFTLLEEALKNGSVGDVALLTGYDDLLIGIWQLVDVDTLLLITPWWPGNVDDAAPAFDWGTHLISVRGDDGSWQASPRGLLPAQSSHVVFVAGGQFPGAYWEPVMQAQVRGSGFDASNAYFGVGLASNTRTQGYAGVLASVSSNWNRRPAEGESGITGLLTLDGVPTTGNRDRALDGNYHRYSIVGEMYEGSAFGSTTPQLILVSRSIVDPLSTAAGSSGGAIISTGFTLQANQDQEIMVVTHTIAGTVEMVVQEVGLVRALAA